VLKTGEEVYKSVCSACHAAGVAGAPAFANNGAWSARVGKGYEALLSSVLKGKGAMPARGGAAPDDVNDLELGRSVVYLVNASGGKLAEPKEATAEKK
jgi:cytochrome c5